MAEQARVTSLDALESFRSSLLIFLTKARRSLDDIGDEVRQTRVWLQSDRRIHWESELRRRSKILEQAEAELLTVRLQKFENAIMVKQAVARRAKAAVDEANDKLRTVKQWTRNYDGLADPCAKRLESLRDFLDHEMPKAIAYITNLQRSLEGYTESHSSLGSDAATPPEESAKEPTPEDNLPG